MLGVLYDPSCGVEIQKLQILKINGKINKNANGLMSKTCFMRNILNMNILQCFIIMILKKYNLWGHF